MVRGKVFNSHRSNFLILSAFHGRSFSLRPIFGGTIHWFLVGKSTGLAYHRRTKPNNTKTCSLVVFGRKIYVSRCFAGAGVVGDPHFFGGISPNLTRKTTHIITSQQFLRSLLSGANLSGARNFLQTAYGPLTKMVGCPWVRLCLHLYQR